MGSISWSMLQITRDTTACSIVPQEKHGQRNGDAQQKAGLDMRAFMEKGRTSCP